MRIAVITNQKAAGSVEAAEKVCAALTELGAEVLLPSSELAFPFNATDELISKADVLIALGGDGTIIHTAKRAAQHHRPVLGINCGHLGFMAGLELDELDKLNAVIDRRYTVEHRMMLEVEILRANGTRESYHALNEAAVTRSALSRMVELEVISGEETVLTYHADGVIVATPTGSTAYSLSAGGPIIDPAVKCLLLTPICAHSLHARSYIFSEDAQLKIRINNADEETIYIMVDGEDGVCIHSGDIVRLTCSPLTAKMIKIKQTSFYAVLNQKLTNRR